jgi:hypothetical protein
MTYGTIPVSVADVVAGGRRFGSITAKSPDSCKRSKARSTAAGVGWMYRRETTMLLCPSIRMLVKASTPDSPSLVSIVWRREWRTKSPAKTDTPGAAESESTRQAVGHLALPDPQPHNCTVLCFCGIESWKRLISHELKAAPQFHRLKTGCLARSDWRTGRVL